MAQCARAGEVCLSDPRRAHDEDCLVLVHPVALGEVQHRLALEPAGTAEVDVLDHRGQLELRGLEHACESPIAAGEELPVDEQAEAVLEAESGVVGLLALFDDACGHDLEPKGVQPLDGRVGEHVCSFHW